MTKKKINSTKKIIKDKKIDIKRISIIALIILIVIIILLVLSSSSVFKPKKEIKYVSDSNDPLSIGEKKYLEFLWMVDGAFNYERYNKEDFFVNDKTLKQKPDFSCVYDDKKKTCEAINFENNFKSIFAKNVKLNRVYGDGLSIRWYEKKGDKYQFTNINNCAAGRMNTNQKLVLKDSNKDKMVYQVTYDEELKTGIYKGKHHFDKEFVLVLENDTWKVSEAYYHDPCYMEYNIK